MRELRGLRLRDTVALKSLREEAEAAGEALEKAHGKESVMQEQLQRLATTSKEKEDALKRKLRELEDAVAATDECVDERVSR